MSISEDQGNLKRKSTTGRCLSRNGVNHSTLYEEKVDPLDSIDRSALLEYTADLSGINEHGKSSNRKKIQQ